MSKNAARWGMPRTCGTMGRSKSRATKAIGLPVVRLNAGHTYKGVCANCAIHYYTSESDDVGVCDNCFFNRFTCTP